MEPLAFELDGRPFVKLEYINEHLDRFSTLHLLRNNDIAISLDSEEFGTSKIENLPEWFTIAYAFKPAEI